jgi:hypothetical protein
MEANLVNLPTTANPSREGDAKPRVWIEQLSDRPVREVPRENPHPKGVLRIPSPLYHLHKG